MTKKMEKALTTIERRISNYLAMGDSDRAKEQYKEFDTMLDAMYLNDFLNDKEYNEATYELIKIKHRTLWA